MVGQTKIIHDFSNIYIMKKVAERARHLTTLYKVDLKQNVNLLQQLLIIGPGADPRRNNVYGNFVYFQDCKVHPT